MVEIVKQWVIFDAFSIHYLFFLLPPLNFCYDSKMHKTLCKEAFLISENAICILDINCKGLGLLKRFTITLQFYYTAAESNIIQDHNFRVIPFWAAGCSFAVLHHQI